MQNVTETESIIMGDIEDEQLKEIETEKGIIINEIIEKEQVETPGRIILNKRLENYLDKETLKSIKTNSKIIYGLEEIKTDIYIIRLKGPLVEEWRKQLDELNIKPIESLPTYSFTAKLTPTQYYSIKEKEFVDYIRVYDEIDTSSILSNALSTKNKGIVSDIADKPIKEQYDIVLHLADDLESTLKWMKSKKIKIIDKSSKIIRCEIEDNNVIQQLKELPEVALVDRPPRYTFHCNISKLLVNIDTKTDNSEIMRCIEEQGENQIVCVADGGGIFKDHPDIKNNLLKIRRFTGDTNEYLDISAHGTHIAGILVGDGTSSEGKICGIAPKAKLLFQSLKVEEEEIKIDLGGTSKLLEDAYNIGSRICNYSFGSTGTQYSKAYEVDEFIANHPDMLIIRSAGENMSESKKGFVNWYSLDVQAGFKNGLSVGASRSIRDDGPNANKTWREWNPNLYPDDPIGSEKVCGNKECMAAFSGRGPAYNTRIKPDLTAPGTDILSTRSIYDETRYRINDIHENPNYAYLSGTSFAAPIVTGCATLIREYYIKKCSHNPSAALLKATIINGTSWLTGQDATVDHNQVANIHQGFGLVNLQQSIPNKGNQDLKLEFIDTWKNNDLKLFKVGDRHIFEFSCQGGPFIRVCMTYTDLPGNGLQNNLSVFLEHVDSKKFWIGNEEIQKFLEAEIQKTDIHNNIEVIRIKNPMIGTYRIHIVCWDIIKPPQDFALVLTGNNITKLTYIPNSH